MNTDCHVQSVSLSRVIKCTYERCNLMQVSKIVQDIMDEYDCIKKSKLKFKGEKRKKKRKTTKLKDEEPDDELASKDEKRNDAEEHGGWWKVDKYDDIRDEVVIEFLPGCYARAMSNGSIVLGKPHPPGEGPDEEEIFTAICAATNQIALKTGFGRYISIDSRKKLMGLSEAIGEPETFLPVFEDGKTALCAYLGLFLAPEEDSDDQHIMAKSDKAGPYEMCTIRVNHDPSFKKSKTK